MSRSRPAQRYGGRGCWVCDAGENRRARGDAGENRRAREASWHAVDDAACSPGFYAWPESQDSGWECSSDCTGCGYGGYGYYDDCYELPADGPLRVNLLDFARFT